jgi:diaminohydroxyphosphoribosylaminopyrimidine deaminase/5-amino-6-(5-phosphoribosylamino)uracil reductase
MKKDLDLAFMEMAYGLAENGRGFSSPNPMVGSVIARGGSVVGFGFHEEAGEPHAEVMALRRAGRRSRGATIYITLEPCVHWGRTPPCVDSLLGAGLKRAVVSAYDPNPLVNRKGVARLKAAGLKVGVGLLGEKNARLNEVYIKYITRKVPFVTLKAAVSLDGKTASRTGDSRWITGKETRDFVHLLRGEHDAVMIGVNTLIRDDPRLTVRHPSWGEKQIVRVVLDSKLQFPLTARILSTLRRGRIIVFAETGAPARKSGALEKKGVEVVFIDNLHEKGGLEAVLAELGRREIAGLLVEGGTRLQTAFIAWKLADKLVLCLSPKLIGGRDAPGFFEGGGVERVGAASALKNLRHFSLGDDIILEGYF